MTHYASPITWFQVINLSVVTRVSSFLWHAGNSRWFTLKTWYKPIYQIYLTMMSDEFSKLTWVLKSLKSSNLGKTPTLCVSFCLQATAPWVHRRTARIHLETTTRSRPAWTLATTTTTWIWTRLLRQPHCSATNSTPTGIRTRTTTHCTRTTCRPRSLYTVWTQSADLQRAVCPAAAKKRIFFN